MRELITVALALFAGGYAQAGEADCAAFLDYDVRKLRSEERINLCDAFAGRPLLIVNTASRCGFTPQFAGLEALNQRVW